MEDRGDTDCANLSASSSDKSQISSDKIIEQSDRSVTTNKEEQQSDKLSPRLPKCTKKEDKKDDSTHKSDKKDQIYPTYNDLSPVTSVTLSLQKKEEKKINDKNDKNDSFSDMDHDSVSEAVGKSKIALIYSLLYTSDRLNRKQISEKLNIPLNTVTVTMNRNNDRFIECDTIDSLISYKLSPLAIKEVEDKIIALKNIKESIDKEKAKKKLKERESEDFKDNINNALQQIKPKIEGSIATVNFNDILLFNKDLADKLLDKPLEAIEDIKEFYNELGVNDIRFTNLPETQNRTAEALRCNDIDKMLIVEGRCVSLSSPRPVITESKYECPSCGTIISMVQTETKLQEPSRCSCGRRIQK